MKDDILQSSDHVVTLVIGTNEVGVTSMNYTGGIHKNIIYGRRGPTQVEWKRNGLPVMTSTIEYKKGVIFQVNHILENQDVQAVITFDWIDDVEVYVEEKLTIKGKEHVVSQLSHDACHTILELSTYQKTIKKVLKLTN